MKVLVLGGCGFIGSHLVDRLVASGHQVRIVDRSQEKYRKPLSHVEYQTGNTLDQTLLINAMDGIDVVCHLVSTTVPSTSNLNPVKDVEENLVGTLNILEAMRHHNVQRILFLSSGGTVYGNVMDIPVQEEAALHPICSYGVVKVAIENYLQMYQSLYGLQPIVLRPSNPYGPRQGHTGVQGLIGTLLSAAIENKPIEIWGDGSIVRDFLHVSDLIELAVDAMCSDQTGVVNAGSGSGCSVNEMIHLVEEVTGKQLEVIYKSSRGFDVKEIVLDIKRARDMFSWQPRVSLSEGLLDQYKWLSAVLA